MIEPPRPPSRLAVLLGRGLPWVVAAVTLFLYLGDFPLLAPDEGRNAEVAREMFERGAWLVPTYDGLVYLDKPAFFFKAVALSYSLLGVSESAARLPSALFALALLVVVHGFARREYGRRTADLAVLVLATTPLYVAFARLVIFDMSLAFFVCTSIFSAYRAETGPESDRRRWNLLAVALGSLATLVKGPVGFILPLLVIMLFLGLDGRRGAIRRLFAPVHWLVFLAIVAPWFFGLTWQHPDFAYYGIIKESLSRFSTTEFKRTQPFYFFGAIVAGCVFPWSLLLPESAWLAWKRRAGWSSADRLLIGWVVAVILFFSFSQSKLPGYILSAVVALGILIARVLAAESAPSQALVRRATFVLVASMLAVAVFLLQLAGLEQPWPWLAKATPEQWDRYVPAVKALAYTAAAVALVSAAAALSRRRDWTLAAFAMLPLALLTVHADLPEQFMAGRSAKALAAALGPLPPEVEVACLHCLPPGLPFYLKRYVTVVTDDGREFTSNYVLFTLRSGPLDPRRVVPLAGLRPRLRQSDHPVFLLADPLGKPELEAIAQRRGAHVVQLDDKHWGALLPAAAAQVRD